MKLLLFGVGALMLLPSVAPAQTRPGSGRQVETYETATLDARGRLVITTSDGKTIRVPKEGDQSAFSRPIISADRTAVGAQADFPNCCTSYDIPLQPVIYANGKAHRFTGIGLPIFQWHFADGGSRVAFGEERCITTGSAFPNSFVGVPEGSHSGLALETVHDATDG